MTSPALSIEMLSASARVWASTRWEKLDEKSLSRRGIRVRVPSVNTSLGIGRRPCSNGSRRGRRRRGEDDDDDGGSGLSSSPMFLDFFVS